MSVFSCARCHAIRDSDDGCDESPGGRLVCVDCVDEMEDEDAEAQLFVPSKPISSIDVILAIEAKRGDVMFSSAARALRDYTVKILDELEEEVREIIGKAPDKEASAEAEGRSTPTQTKGEG